MPGGCRLAWRLRAHPLARARLHGGGRVAGAHPAAPPVAPFRVELDNQAASPHPLAPVDQAFHPLARNMHCLPPSAATLTKTGLGSNGSPATFPKRLAAL